MLSNFPRFSALVIVCAGALLLAGRITAVDFSWVCVLLGLYHAADIELDD